MSRGKPKKNITTVGGVPNSGAAGAAQPTHITPQDVEAEILSGINKVYAPESETAKDALAKLMARYHAMAPGKARNDFVDSVKSELNNFARVRRQVANVEEQKARIREASLEPQEKIGKDGVKKQVGVGAINLEPLVDEMEDKMAVSPHRRWKYSEDKYGSNRHYGKKQKEIDEIKDGLPKLHTMPLRSHPSTRPGYRKLLQEADYQTRKELVEAAHSLNSLMETGVVFRPKPQAAKRVAKSVAMAPVNAAGNLAISGFEALQKLVNYAGRGIYSESDYKQNRSLRDYYDYRNKTLSSLLWNLQPGRSRNSAVMKKCQRILEESQNNPEGMLDEASFQSLMKLFTDEMKGLDDANSAKIAEFNKSINDLNKQVIESAKDKTHDEDEMWKWRLLQMALIITPFAGLNIMGPITSLFSTVFMNAGGLGAGIASLATGEVTGPFGELCELLHIDEAIRWLLCDMPGVSDIVGLADELISSNVVQSVLGGMILPTAGSPLTGVALAGVFSLFRAQAEIAHYDKYKGVFDKHKKAISAEMDKISKESANMPESYKDGKFSDWDVAKFVDKKFDIIENFHRKAGLVEFATERFNNNPDFFTEIMGKDFMKSLEKHQIRDEDGTYRPLIDKDGKIFEVDLMNFLEKIPDTAFYNNVFLYRAIEKESDASTDVAEEFNKLLYDPRAKELIEKEEILQRQDFILNLARDRDINCDKVPPLLRLDENESDPMIIMKNKAAMGQNQQERAREIAKIEKEVKASEVAFFKEDASKVRAPKLKPHILPPTSCRVPQASPMLNNGHSILV